MTTLAHKEKAALPLDNVLESAPHQYVMSPEALNELPEADKLRFSGQAIEAHMERGNGFLIDAHLAASKAETRFMMDSSGEFAAQGVLLAAALIDGSDAVESARTERKKFDRGIESLDDALDGDHLLEHSFRDPANAFVDFLDTELGLPLSGATGRPEARCESATMVALTHIRAGDRLAQRASKLSGAQGSAAANGGRILARAHSGDNSTVEAGTESYYCGRMERSDASDEAKGHFANALGVSHSKYYGRYNDEEGSCEANGAGMEAMERLLEESETRRIEEAYAKLADMGIPFGPDLSRDAGKITSLLVSSPGDKAKLALSIDQPFAALLPAKAGLHLGFEAELENDDGQYKMSSKLAVAAFGEIDAKWAEIELALGVVGTVEVAGDSGEELWDLLRFAVRDHVIRAAPWAERWLADHDSEELAASLDDDDYVELGVGGMVEGTAGWGEEDEAGLRYEGIWVSRFDKEGDDVKRTALTDHSVTATADVGDYSGEAKWKGRRPSRNDPWTQHEIAFKAGGSIATDELNDKLGDPDIYKSTVLQLAEFGADVSGLGPGAHGNKDDKWTESMKRAGRGLAIDQKAFTKIDDAVHNNLIDAGVQQGFSVGVQAKVEGGELKEFKVTAELTNALELNIEYGAEVELAIETSRTLIDIAL